MAEQEPSCLEVPLFQRRKSKSLTPLIFGFEDNVRVAVRACRTPDEYSCQGEKSDPYALNTPFSEKTLTTGFGLEKHRRKSSTSLSSFGCTSPLGSSSSTSFFSLSKSPSLNDQRLNSHSSSSKSNFGPLVATPSLLHCLPIETLEERMSRWAISDDLDKKTNSPSNNPPLFLNGVTSKKYAIQRKNNSPRSNSYLNENYFNTCSPCSSCHDSAIAGSPYLAYPDSRCDARSPIGSPSMQQLNLQTARDQRKSRRNNKSALEFSFESGSL